MNEMSIAQIHERNIKRYKNEHCCEEQKMGESIVSCAADDEADIWYSIFLFFLCMVSLLRPDEDNLALLSYLFLLFCLQFGHK